MKRGRMPAKHGNKQYYKGNTLISNHPILLFQDLAAVQWVSLKKVNQTGAVSLLFKGTFVVNAKKVRDWIIPDLDGFTVKR